jgi:D-sedoheptulose 7-phosphate isomerase
MASYLQFIKQQFKESASVKTAMAEKLSNEINRLAKLFIQALKDDKKILWCGNGGSAADCQHLSTELISRLQFNRPSIPSIALTTNSSFLTAHSNDFGFDSIFSRQIDALGKPGDVLMAISTSGNSRNIIQAIKTAKKKKLNTVALSGKDGGQISRIADYCLIVPSFNTQRIQEGHITIGHILCDLIEQNLFRELPEHQKDHK